MSTNLITANNLSVGNNLTVAGSIILNTIDASNSINTLSLNSQSITLNNLDLNTRITNNESQINTLNLKATQLDTLKAPLASPNFTGVPTCPTATQNSNNNQIANTSYVDTSISNLIGGAPDLLNTLKEIDNAINNDPNVYSTITNQISLKSNIDNPTFTNKITTPAITLNGTDLQTTLNKKSTVNNPYFTGTLTLNGTDLQTTLDSKATLSLANTFTQINTFNSGINFNGFINSISKDTFSFISNISSDVQQQINVLKKSITDITWIEGTFNTTNIANICQTNILTFSTSINNISKDTFSYLTGLTSNIQNQLNSINNSINGIKNNINLLLSIIPPSGSIIARVSTSDKLTISGWILCDGRLVSRLQFPELYNTIGDMYKNPSMNIPGSLGYDSNLFNVPNLNAMFLRGNGIQTINGYQYGSDNSVGNFYNDAIRIQGYNFVNNLSTSRTSVLGGGGTSTINNLYWTNNTIGTGSETVPCYTSVYYFIKT